MRDWEASAIIGGKGQGKSSLVKSLFDSYDLRSQKIIILNNTNPPAFQEYNFLQSDKKLQGKWHGIIRYHNPKGCKQSLEDVCKLIREGKFSNGLLVCDDSTKYILPNVGDDVKEILTDHRIKDLDVIFTTHALRFLPPFCRAMVSTITVFKTGETFEKPSEIKGLEYPNYNALFQAWKEVMAMPEIKVNPKKPETFIQPNLTIETGV